LGLLEVGLKEEEEANGSKGIGNSRMPKDAKKNRSKRRDKNNSYKTESLAQTLTENKDA